jgi:outer membrane receptor protein involved in Fe transport
VPTAFRPDTTTNYEIGFKNDILDHHLSIDASVYYVDWRNIQLNVYIPAEELGYNTNGGHAKSEGVELALQAKPTSWTQISLTGAYNDAELTQNLPQHASAYAVAGDRLPFSNRFMGSLDADQDLAHVGEVVGFVGASASYVGMRYGEFEDTASTPRFIFPAYTVINARAGVRLASWSVNLFLNNAANRLGILGGNFTGSYGSVGGYFAQIIQPRTLGASFTKSF